MKRNGFYSKESLLKQKVDGSRLITEFFDYEGKKILELNGWGFAFTPFKDRLLIYADGDNIIIGVHMQAYLI